MNGLHWANKPEVIAVRIGQSGPTIDCEFRIVYRNALESPSNLAISSSDSRNCIAPAFCSACETFVTPGIVTTVSPREWITQFSATSPGVVLCLAPISCNAVTSARVFSMLPSSRARV